jgi:hypothetical protein
MRHPLEIRYGLTAEELLDALDRRFRARVTLEGAVAEVHMARTLRALEGTVVERFETHDRDDYPDFSVWLPGRDDPLLAECKNVRDADQAYRSEGRVVAYKAETQKTRASRGDEAGRLYSVERFQVLGVCLGKKTGCWSDFLYASVADLDRHREHADKLAVFQRVPLPDAPDTRPWYHDLGALLTQIADGNR